MLLAQQGAEVINIEPLEGDWSRRLMPAYGDQTAFSIVANLGKRGVAVNLKSNQGKEVVERLIPDADIFLEGFRPGVIDRLGFSYDRISKINPQLIYLSISGFGQSGPLSKKPAMDPVLQAFTGFLSENIGSDGVPHRTPVIINDMATALYAQQAVSAALYARYRDPRGRRIEISLMEASANLQSVRLMSGVHDGPYKVPMTPNGTFATKNGWLQVLVLRDNDFKNMCIAVDRPDLSEDARFTLAADRLENRNLLTEILNEIFTQYETEYWRQKLSLAGIQNEAVQTYKEFVKNDHVVETGLISWLDHPGSEVPWPVPNVPGLPRLQRGNPEALSPRVGEDTRAVMRELKYSDTEIDTLAVSGIIKL